MTETYNSKPLLTALYDNCRTSHAATGSHRLAILSRTTQLETHATLIDRLVVAYKMTRRQRTSTISYKQMIDTCNRGKSLHRHHRDTATTGYSEKCIILSTQWVTFTQPSINPSQYNLHTSATWSPYYSLCLHGKKTTRPLTSLYWLYPIWCLAVSSKCAETMSTITHCTTYDAELFV